MDKKKTKMKIIIAVASAVIGAFSANAMTR